MKKSIQAALPDDSYTVGEAASLLGLSIPTVKRMARAGTLGTFRTPGGHLRVLAESVEAIKEQRRSPAPSAHAPSPVLKNRREHLEELTLEAQEHRARRELTKLQREEQEETERREAEAQARQEDAEQRRAEIELERDRLEREKTEDRRRRQRERAEEQERFDAERELIQFRLRWCNAAAEAVARLPRLYWLTAAQRKELIDAIEAEVEHHQRSDEPRMMDIIARTLEAALEPLKAERDAQERRQRLTAGALASLPYSATDADKAKATVAIREAVRQFDPLADVCEMRVAAQGAVEPVRQAIERRELDAKLVRWAIWELPWSKNDQDVARIRRECTEILSELPADISEVEGKEALQPTIGEARQEVEQRQAEKERQAKKARLVAEGVAEVVSYMREMERKGEITYQEYWDRDLTEHLRIVVRRSLEADMTGEETTKEAREATREIVDAELE